MSKFMRAVLLAGASLAASSGAVGAQGAAKPAAAPEAPGKEVLQRRCFQCHAASMWTSLRQDRKEWEGTLYRMVGRGALWTEAEIAAMADFLAQTRGPVK
jgi:cytochrome c5